MLCFSPSFSPFSIHSIPATHTHSQTRDEHSSEGGKKLFYENNIKFEYFFLKKNTSSRFLSEGALVVLSVLSEEVLNKCVGDTDLDSETQPHTQI